ncbi:NAD(P)-binding protein [Leptolyngbya sp. FACHB-261]|uniref:NAD(P)-binding protein n=1 Tax=Leptolyngbya sp. FACHB-261 TaxID=2692806 RepID=UPI001684EB99|nr:NAD(P)-binding protein [Leptolyngbya sp. FACHB-261]MBD2099849.1 NAD(P)/FAD-dependent oxidoreductase [Leptolyngbya sp. FACHB-261]
MQAYDVVLTGAGHNALVCAAYPLKVGYSVLLLEKNSIPRGGCTTKELLPEDAPGFLFNPCAIDHIFIHQGPIAEELELNRYGLEYLFCDPVVFYLNPHPGSSISGMPGRNCARTFLHKQHPIAQTLADAGDSLKSTAKSVFHS